MEASSPNDQTERTDDPDDSTRCSDGGGWHEIQGITGERKHRYRIRWMGTDPQTGKPWPQQWVGKSEVTSDAELEWKERKKAKRGKKRPRDSRGQKQIRKGAPHVTPHQCLSGTPALPDDDDDRTSDIRRAERARLSAPPPASENRVDLDSPAQTSEYRPTQSFAWSSQDPSSPLPRILSREGARPFSRPSVRTTSAPPASNPPSRRKPFSVAIERSQGFGSARYRCLSDTVFAPCTQTDSSNPSTSFTVEESIVTNQRSVVIPDSQGFYDEPGFSTFVASSQEILSQERQEAVTSTSLIEVPSVKESLLDELVGERAQIVLNSTQPQGPAEPPTSSEQPPALLQTIATNSAFEHNIPPAEATFRTPPVPEPESARTLVVQEEKRGVSQEAQPIANLRPDLSPGGHSQGDESFDLDLPQGLDLPYPSGDEEPVAEDTLVGESPKEADQEVSVPEITGAEDSRWDADQLADHVELLVEGTEGAVSEGASIEERPQEKLHLSSEKIVDLQYQAGPRRTTTSPAPGIKPWRRQLLRKAPYQDWFRVEQNSQRGFSEPPTTVAQPQQPGGIDFPLAYLGFTDQDFPLPLALGMSPAPALPVVGKWGSLREMLAAKRRDRDEDMARRRTSASREPSAGAPAIPKEPTPISQPSYSEPNAQIPLHPLPIHTQVPGTTMNTQTSTPAARVEVVKQDVGMEPRSKTFLFHVPLLGPAEYAIPLPLGTEGVTPGGISQKALYLREIVNRHADIESYLELRREDAKRVAYDLAYRCAKIATLPNMDYPIATLDGEDTKKGVNYLTVMSAKFRFLRDLFTTILDENIKVGIVAEAPGLIDILEVFFRGLKIFHKRLDQHSTHKPLPDNAIEGFVQVYLVPSSRGSGIVGTTCHVVIAMDVSFDPLAPEVAQIRQDMYNPKKLAPVLRLITVNTIEHAMLCIPRDPDLFLYGSIEAIRLLRNEAGMVDPAYAAAIGDASSKAAAWIKRKCQGELGIPPLQQLPLFDAAALSHNQTQREGEDHGDKRKRQDSLSQVQDISESELKKRKLQLSSDGVGDVTHISNTMTSQSQDYATRPGAPGRQAGDGGEAPMVIDDSETESEPEPEHVHKKYARPVQPIGGDAPLEQMTREELIEEIKFKTADLKSWMECQGRLQTNWEEQRESLRELKLHIAQREHVHERELKQTKTKLERTLADIDKYKGQISNLEEQITQARALLRQDSPIAHATLVANVDLKKQVANLTRKLESTERDAAFAREQYQTASNASFEIRNEVKVLEEANADLQRRADENTVKIREIFRDTQVHDRDRRIQELRVLVAQRDNEIKRLQGKVKDAEPQQVKRGFVPRRVVGASPAGSRSSSPSVRK